MYSIVTHTIKEEHFGHPMTAEVGMAIHANAHPIHGNVYTGNIQQSNAMPITKRVTTEAGAILPPYGKPVFPPGTKPEGNIKVKMWEYSWGDYDAWGNLSVWGDTVVSGDITSYGTISGTGTLTSISTLDTEPTSPKWTGTKGEICINSRFVYLCVDTDTWVRIPVQTTW